VNALSRRDFLRAASGVAAGTLFAGALPAARDGSPRALSSGEGEGGRALDFAWRGARPWLGPDWYAGPLHSWSVADGIVGCAPDSLEPRYATVATRELRAPGQGFAMETELRFDPELDAKGAYWSGFLVGGRGAPDTFEHAVVYPEKSFFAGLGADRTLRLGGKRAPVELPDGWVRLRLIGEGRHDGRVRVRLVAAESSGRSLGELSTVLPKERLAGAFGLHARGRRGSEETPDSVAAFRSFAAEGRGIVERPDNRFGPILWTQYSVSGAGLRLQAQFPPLGEADAHEAVLEMRDSGGGWREAARAPIEPVASVALFELAEWDRGASVPYRVRYPFLGRDYFWEGVVRREPAADEPWRLGLFSCDYGTLFPLTELIAESRERDPAMVFFAGDQFYEWVGGFLFVRTPPWKARLDYLRKWYLFGWTYRHLLKDRPSIILTDDHDVFQGNIWGHGGRPLPGYDPGEDNPFKAPVHKGGYAMPPDWVNLVQRTQSGHLPPPFDPEPVKQGIDVYYTDFTYGGVSFAVLEDRKFKSGPASEKARSGDAELLGERQLAFLEEWAQAWTGARMKTVLSQTIFAQPTTHVGGPLKRNTGMRDNNAWPRSRRDAAVAAIRKAGAFSLHGDQHFALAMRHGVETWEDAGVAFMGPATVAGFPRAFWPDDAMRRGPAQAPARSSPHAGRFLDDFGHKITVDAVANPLPPDGWDGEYPNNSPDDPTRLAMDKASGYAMIDYAPAAREITINCYPLPHAIDGSRLDGEQYAGWPLTYSADMNDGRAPVGRLPELRFDVADPVVGVYKAGSGELIYARRIRGTRFAPPVFENGRYTVRGGVDKPEREVGVYEPASEGATPVKVRLRRA